MATRLSPSIFDGYYVFPALMAVLNWPAVREGRVEPTVDRVAAEVNKSMPASEARVRASLNRLYAKGSVTRTLREAYPARTWLGAGKLKRRYFVFGLRR